MHQSWFAAVQHMVDSIALSYKKQHNMYTNLNICTISSSTNLPTDVQADSYTGRLLLRLVFH